MSGGGGYCSSAALTDHSDHCDRFGLDHCDHFDRSRHEEKGASGMKTCAGPSTALADRDSGDPEEPEDCPAGRYWHEPPESEGKGIPKLPR